MLNALAPPATPPDAAQTLDLNLFCFWHARHHATHHANLLTQKSDIKPSVIEIRPFIAPTASAPWSAIQSA